MEDEVKRLERITNEIQTWWSTPRFSNVERPYTAKQVAALRPTLPLTYHGQIMAKKLWKILCDAKAGGYGEVTLGALDPVQIANQAKYLKTVYVSGWQCSSTASTSNEPGPDFADYPSNTVPNKVDQLFRSLCLRDRIQNEERSKMTPEQRAKTPKYDFFPCMVADLDAGFGGVSSTMKVMKMFIEAGASGIHIEDQRPGNKKCGHMGGKVLVSTREHCNRIIACRLQADIMGAETVIIARTDSLGAKLIDSNYDPTDQPFIQGVCADGKLRTYPEAGVEQIRKNFTGNQKDQTEKAWLSNVYNFTLKQAQDYAKNHGFAFEFDWEKCRTAEGFYQIKGCVELCAARARQYLRFADCQWMETDSPSMKLAQTFASLCLKYHPKKMLAYNLSPSFNWSAFNMTDEQILNFCKDLGKMGYVFQFITLAGFHLNALKSEKLSKDFATRNMLAYVEKIQRKEGKHKVDQLTHQRWSGANYLDTCISLVEPQSKTLAGSSESTENQFKH